MEDLDIIKSCVNNYNVYIKVTKDNIKYKDIFKKYIENGLLLQSKPNLIVTRELKKLLEEEIKWVTKIYK